MHSFVDSSERVTPLNNSSHKWTCAILLIRHISSNLNQRCIFALNKLLEEKYS